MIDAINNDLKRRGTVIAYIVQNGNGVQVIQYDENGKARFVSNTATGPITISERIASVATKHICDLT